MVKVLNLNDMEQSDGYNPLAYIREDEDILRLISALMDNTTPKNAQVNDPFWPKAESMYLQALFFYVYKKYPIETRNLNSVLDLLDEGKIPEDGTEPKLTKKMQELYKENPKHPAALAYFKVMEGAEETVRSVLMSVEARLAFFRSPQLRRIFERDQMDLSSLGTGKNGDGKTKTALFCVIPVVDKSFNFVIGFLYTQLFQQLYDIGDKLYDGPLPIPVEFWMDEFANVPLPTNFCEILSTVRGYNISCQIIIQNVAQIKALFKDTWETITGNCSTLVYLGGNEASTFKYISEQLGKWTIDKRSYSESLGKNGSHSDSYDIMGRELLTPDEVRKLDPKKCICLVAGVDPVLDLKYQTFKKKQYQHIKALGKYRHVPLPPSKADIFCLNEDELAFHKKRAEVGEKVKVITLDLKTFLAYDFSGTEKAAMDLSQIKACMEKNSEALQKADKEAKREESQRQEDIDTYLNSSVFTEGQKEQILLALQQGVPEEKVRKHLLNPQIQEKKMEQIRQVLEQQIGEENV